MAIINYMFLLGREIICYTLVLISVPNTSFCLNIYTIKVYVTEIPLELG